MKTIIFFSILFCVIALPALGELTPQDLDQIRLIVNDSEKRIKAELKEDITETKRELKEDITETKEELKTYIDIKIDGVEKRLAMYNWVLYVVMPLIVLAIGVPTAIMAYGGAGGIAPLKDRLKHSHRK